MPNSEINFFAETTFRRERRRFGIKLDDRRKHMYLIGKTGMGKTNMMSNMAIQDIQAGRGVCFIDPHGETAESLLDFIPASRINDVIYFNPADFDFPIAFNVMEKVDLSHRHLVASGLMGVFKKIWPDVWSARMEYILNNSILALLEYPGSTLLGINRMMADPEYRQKVVEKITDPVVKAFWLQEYARYTQRYEVEATAAIQNKVGQFISAPIIRNIIGQVSSKIDMREIMDNRKILIMNLSKGRTGEDNSTLLGALLVTKLQLAAMSRVDIPEEERADFFLYVDEFQNFATESFATILSEARKYRLDLILGHQYITQMTEEVRDAVFGNVGTIVCFRIGAEDAEFLEKEFTPEFMATDLVNLGKYNVYLKLMIDGLAGRGFSAETLPPVIGLEKSSREKIIKVSRERYGTQRKIVEDKISRWTGMTEEKIAAMPPREPLLYDAQCASCKKWTKVVFKPDGKRPVYCKACLKNIQREREKPVEEKPAPEQSQPLPPPPPQPQPQSPLSLEEAMAKEPVSFSSKRDRIRKAPEIDRVKEMIKEALKPKDQA
ncbi:MAG: type IV secretion system DNA-binding domain-containing protein [bacterium]|nr:type IV secretion system DNA-binding domain-containing protein [bacterium]